MRNLASFLLAIAVTAQAAETRLRVEDAPKPFHDLIKYSVHNNRAGGVPEAEAKIKAMGSRAVPWLVAVLRDTAKHHPQIRSNAAQLLAELGRWDELYKALASTHAEAAAAAGPQFSLALLNRRGAEIEPYLARIERLAGSGAPASRAAAMGILGDTNNEELAAVCIRNLSYGDDRSQRAAARLSGQAGKEALDSFNRICGGSMDQTEYMAAKSAMWCIEKLEAAAAIPALVEIGLYSSEPSARHDAFRVLSAIGKKDFGGQHVPGESEASLAQLRRNRCEEQRGGVHRALAAAGKGPGGAARASKELGDIVSFLKREASAQRAIDPDSGIAESWKEWAASRRPDAGRARDESVGLVMFQPTRTIVELRSSGAVTVSGPQPGMTGSMGSSGFTTLEQLEHHVRSLAEAKGNVVNPPGWEKISRWLLDTAIPELQRKRGSKQAHQ